MKVLWYAILLLLVVSSVHALEGFAFPEAAVSLSDSLTVSDTAIYQYGYVSDDAQNWQRFTFSGRNRGNWIIGQATSNVRTDANYYAIYSCSWSGGWSCRDNWQVYDTTAQQFIVQNNQPQADIVVSADAPNMVKLAAEYFQSDIQDMTGATLPIRNAPGDDYDFHVYIGESQYTDDLGITSEGTEYDGYKIVSGNNYLVMLGDDTPYDPASELSDEEWAELTAPDVFVHTYYDRRDSYGEFGIYEQDGKGSMNAVHDFLETQGMRWYYPDSFGTITPSKSSIIVTPQQKTINPDYAMRAHRILFKNYGLLGNSGWHPEGKDFGQAHEWLRWRLAIGQNNEKQVMTGRAAHGMYNILDVAYNKENHPEYYAVWNGELMNGDDPKPNLCSEEFKQAVVRFHKAMIEAYDAEYVSIWPSDGYTHASQHSQECRDKETPERGRLGKLSDYVFNFVNDAAWEVYDEYGADHKSIHGAYGHYRLPPTTIENPRGVAPNLAVMLVDNRVQLTDQESRDQRNALVDGWNEIAPGEVFVYDKFLDNWLRNPIEHQVPKFRPYIIEQDHRDLEGKVNGEFDEVQSNQGVRQNDQHDSFAGTALNLYVTAKLNWNNSLEIDPVLDEYYELYFGPASDTMRELHEYSEEHIAVSSNNPKHLKVMRGLAEQAIQQVPSGSVYEERITALLQMMNSNYVGEEVEISSCQHLISPGTTYKLTQDVESSGTCFDIDHQGITLDCQGNTIRVSGDGDAHGISLEARRTGRGYYSTIRNCDVIATESALGIRVSNADHITITDNTVEARARAIWTGNIVNLTLTNNVAHSENGDGAYVQNGGHMGTDVVSRNTIVGNVFSSENAAGTTIYNPTGERVVDNTFTSVNSWGMRMFNPVDSLLQNNIISSDSRSATYISNPTNLTKVGNTITNS